MKRIKTLFSALYRPKVILWIGITIIVAMCLFPPFVSDSKTGHRRGYANLFSDGISFVDRPVEHFKNPITGKMFADRPHYGFVEAHIDFIRLIIQCAIVGLITGGLVYTLKDKKTEGSGK